MPSASNKIGKLLLTPTLPLKGDTECLCTPFAADGSVRMQVLSINIQEKKWKQLSQMKPFRMKMIFHEDLDPQATNLLFATNADAITEITQLASRHDFYALFTIESAEEPVLFYMGEKPLQRRSTKADEADVLRRCISSEMPRSDRPQGKAISTVEYLRFDRNRD